MKYPKDFCPICNNALNKDKDKVWCKQLYHFYFLYGDDAIDIAYFKYRILTIYTVFGDRAVPCLEELEVRKKSTNDFVISLPKETPFLASDEEIDMFIENYNILQ